MQFQKLSIARKYNNLLQIYHNEVEPNYTPREVGFSFLLLSALSEAYCETGEWEKGIAPGLNHLYTLTQRPRKSVFLKNMGCYVFKTLCSDPPKVNLNNPPLDKMGGADYQLKEKSRRQEHYRNA